jgi:hypothetical protein
MIVKISFLKANLNTMLAFRYIFIATLIVISMKTMSQPINKIRISINAIDFTTPGNEIQTLKKSDTTENQMPRNGKYLILTYGSNPANPLKLGYFTLNGNEYKYFDLEGKLLGEGNYTYEASEKQIKWQSGPFKSVGWVGNFEIEHEGKTHTIRLHSNTVGTNTLE